MILSEKSSQFYLDNYKRMIAIARKNHYYLLKLHEVIFYKEKEFRFFDIKDIPLNEIKKLS